MPVLALTLTALALVGPGAAQAPASPLIPDLYPGDVVIGTAVGHHDFGAFTAAAFVRGPTRNPATGVVDPAYFAADPRLLAAARRVRP